MADGLTEDVFEPLGMQHSYARLQDVLTNEADIASGFGYASAGDPFAEEQPELGEPGWVTPEDHIDNAFLRPAGLVWSTASDQARLLGFLARGDEQVLPDELLRAQLTPHASMFAHSQAATYGYGVSLSPGLTYLDGQYRATPLVGHGGETLTMTSASLLLPEQEVAVVLLANARAVDLTPYAFAVLDAAAADRLPGPSDEPTALPPSEDLSQYVGEYLDAQYGPAEITLVDGHLLIDMPLVTELGAVIEPELQPLSLDIFLATIDEAQYPLSFYADEEGTMQYAVSGLEGIVLVRQP